MKKDMLVFATRSSMIRVQREIDRDCHNYLMNFYPFYNENIEAIKTLQEFSHNTMLATDYMTLDAKNTSQLESIIDDCIIHETMLVNLWSEFKLYERATA